MGQTVLAFLVLAAILALVVLGQDPPRQAVAAHTGVITANVEPIGNRLASSRYAHVRLASGRTVVAVIWGRNSGPIAVETVVRVAEYRTYIFNKRVYEIQPHSVTADEP
jgi:hypothetical protein